MASVIDLCTNWQVAWPDTGIFNIQSPMVSYQSGNSGQSTNDSGPESDTVQKLQEEIDTLQEEMAVLQEEIDVHIRNLQVEPGTGTLSQSERRYETDPGSRVMKEILGEMRLNDQSRARGEPRFHMSSFQKLGKLLQTQTCAQPDSQHYKEALPWAARRQRERKLRKHRLKRRHEEGAESSLRKKQRHGMLSNRLSNGRAFFAGDNLAVTDQRKMEEYDHVKILGRGGQGDAHLMKSRSTGSLVVCKVIIKCQKKYSRGLTYNYGDELFFLRNALPPHPRIIHLQSALTSPTQIQLYLDYCNGGDLSSLIFNFNSRYNLDTRESEYSRIPESFIWHVFLQIAEAVAYIHQGYDYRHPDKELPKDWLSVIHRDIKPHNILLQRAPDGDLDHPGPERYPRIILADFGTALRAGKPGEEPTSDEYCGTKAYQPPETPDHSQIGDVYSVGAIICKMLTGYVPNYGMIPNDMELADVFDTFETTLVQLESERADYIFPSDSWPYSQDLVYWVGKAMEMMWMKRVGSLELVEGIRNAEARRRAEWVGLEDWAWEWQHDGGKGWSQMDAIESKKEE
ncbi:MAG: hypothetical protein Q9218_007514 [Villophora microphyllina]